MADAHPTTIGDLPDEPFVAAALAPADGDPSRAAPVPGQDVGAASGAPPPPPPPASSAEGAAWFSPGNAPAAPRADDTAAGALPPLDKPKIVPRLVFLPPAVPAAAAPLCGSSARVVESAVMRAAFQAGDTVKSFSLARELAGAVSDADTRKYEKRLACFAGLWAGVDVAVKHAVVLATREHKDLVAWCVKVAKANDATKKDAFDVVDTYNSAVAAADAAVPRVEALVAQLDKCWSLPSTIKEKIPAGTKLSPEETAQHAKALLGDYTAALAAVPGALTGALSAWKAHAEAAEAFDKKWAGEGGWAAAAAKAAKAAPPPPPDVEPEPAEMEI